MPGWASLILESSPFRKTLYELGSRALLPVGCDEGLVATAASVTAAAFAAASVTAAALTAASVAPASAPSAAAASGPFATSSEARASSGVPTYLKA